MGESNTLIEYVTLPEYTCGLCYDVSDKSIINQHGCLQGYKQLWINSKNNYFYPLLDDNVTVIIRDTDGNEKKIPFEQIQNETCYLVETAASLKRKFDCLPTKIKREFYGLRQTKHFTYEDEEDLILEVREREPLWNNKLPLEERTIRIRTRMWQEISDALGGKLTLDGAKAKFKNLWDSYRRIIQAENSTKNGTTKKDSKRKWHHYESMEFLRESCLLAKKTSSNIENTNDSLGDDNNCDMTNSTTPQSNSKKSSAGGKIRVKNFISSDEKSNDINIGNFQYDKEKQSCKFELIDDFCDAGNPGDSQIDNSDLEIATSSIQAASKNKILWERIADAFCSSQSNEEPLALIPQRDEIDSILYVIGCRARKVSRKKAMAFLNKFFVESCILENEEDEK